MNELREVKEIFDKITNVSAKKSKESIIKQNADNKLFLECLKFLLDDNIVTGLSDKKINKDVPLSKDVYIRITDMFDYLKTHNTGTAKDISFVKLFISIQEEDLKEFCKGLFTKKLKIGVDKKTVNKVIPGLIPTHDVMLAGKYEGKLKEPVSMSLKLDGIRCSICTINGITKALSRQGKEITGIDYILEEYKELKLTDYFIDGELIRINKEMLPSDENFRLTTKIVNSKSLNKEGLEFVVFDMTTMEEYNNKKGILPYKDRMRMMSDYIGKKGEYIKLVPKYGITDKVEDVEDKLNQVVNRGQEGLILNTLSGKYEFGKRPKSLLKVKKFNEADVLVTNVLLGDGKYKDVLGKIEVQFKYKGNVYTNFIGSGFSDFERKYYINHKDEIIGKVITIKVFELTENQNDGVGLRFPTWQGKEYIRLDKNGIDDTNVE